MQTCRVNSNLKFTLPVSVGAVISRVDLQDRSVVAGRAPGAGEVNMVVITSGRRIHTETMGTVVTVRV